ncbi:hypothetical protein Plec18167_004885 [Paecilomyces lecythidis]|uniref:Tyrosine decarboxylase n=1 Tax=Paecilomyces lecythidis TaxID=3004212 RepID=A0ABR3XNV6_9EURO
MDAEHTAKALQGQEAIQQQLWKTALSPWESGVLPSADSLDRARKSLKTFLGEDGIGLGETQSHILEDIVPGFNGGSISPNYYGFVTGGATPAALFADNVVSAYDQNVQVHLPNHSIVTDVEYAALGLLADLLRLDRQHWQNGTFSTGATASNIMGLACGREFVLRTAAERNGSSVESVGEYGYPEVLKAAGIERLQVLSTMPHSSLGKAAGMLGIGRANVKNICIKDDPLQFDMGLLKEELAKPGTANIVAISCGEVNTGRFATNGIEQMKEIRKLCDEYGAWVHVDGAFGAFGRILDDTPEFSSIKAGCEGLELADSITGDGHKLLNVPYDCGFFLCRHAHVAGNVFQNANAAYLSSGDSSGIAILSPLNIGIENSRRFRALPVYSSLISYGKSGYREMLKRQIRLARMISEWLYDHPAYNVLPASGSKEELLQSTYMVVLFSARDDRLNEELSKKINATSKIFVSGTVWEGRPACRIAISNWRVDEQRDFPIVTGVLQGVSEITS